jgi:hypothetical protein
MVPFKTLLLGEYLCVPFETLLSNGSLCVYLRENPYEDDIYVFI